MTKYPLGKKIIFMTLLLSTLLLDASTIDKMINKVSQTNASSTKSQTKIDIYTDKEEQLFSDYIRISKELKKQKLYNKRLELFVSTQKNEIPKLQKQLKEIVLTHKKIIPLMFEMVNTLDQLLAVDTPFLPQERAQRLKNLKSYLANSDIEISQQFRMIIDTYKTEYAYARTLEVYRAQLSDDKSKTVDFLRVGRLALYYQSLDLQESAIYDLASKKWIILEASYNQDISKAIKMARKKLAPDFLNLPIFSQKARQ